MAFIRKIKAALVTQDSSVYIGEDTYLFYDIVTGCIRMHDGTPGGAPICGGGGPGGTAWGDITGDINTQLDLQAQFDDYILLTEKGAINGVATLDGSGTVPAAQLPSYVDDVLEYANLASFPVTGETGKIYVALDTNFIYRWSGATYINISTADSTAELGFIRTFIGKDGVGAENPLYSSIVYVTQNGSLEAAIGELDAAINNVVTNTNLWATFNADSGTTSADTTADIFGIAGGTGVSTAIVGDTLTITNDSPNVDQNLFATLTVTDTDIGYIWAATGSIAADSTTDIATLVSGNGINIDVDSALDAIRVTNTLPNVDQNLFGSIAVATQSSIVADTTSDTLTLIAGTNVTITTNAATDEITINSAAGGGTQNLWETFNADAGSTTANLATDTLTVAGGTGISTAIVGDVLTITNTGGAGTQNVFETIAVSGQSNVVADTTTDTLTLVAGTNITITTNAGTDEITINSAAGGGGDPDQNLWETVSGDTGSAVANTTTDTLTIAGGAGITTSVAGDTLTVANSTTPDNTVINITTVQTVDSVIAEMGKWIIRVIENGVPTNVLTEEILATHDGTNPKFTEYAILKMGSNITGLAINVTLTGGNTLNVTVVSTPGVDVQIKRVAVF